MSHLPAILAATAMGLCAGTAAAHVTLTQPQAVAGTEYEVALRIGHGCEGAPTTGLRLRIPEGFVANPPDEKPGWEVSSISGNSDDATTDSTITEVIWSGGNLPDHQHDEFTLSGRLAADLPIDQPLYFPVIQICGDASQRWIEVPAAGQSSHDLRAPAPALTVLPPA